MHAEITAYKGRIIFNLITRKSVKNEVITKLDKPETVGHVIINTKKNLGISQEALNLLKKINKGDDFIGHLDWSKKYNGLDSFIWNGQASDIKKPCDVEAAKTYKISSYVLIDNNVPQEAAKAIDSAILKFG